MNRVRGTRSTFVSTRDVGGERHLIFRTRKAWAHGIGRWLRKHWAPYARAEGYVVTQAQD